VTLPDAAEAGLVPTRFVAVTVKVYGVPLLSPVTGVVVAPVVDAVKEPGLEVTVYPVIDAPPSETGALHVTVAWVLPAVASAFVGAPGTVAGVTELEFPPGPLPILLTGTTWKV